MALVPQTVDAVSVPVIASGGIVDGRGLAACLLLGAAGVQIGTRFLLARESAAPPVYRAALVSAVETDTVVTTSFTGRPARSIRNRFVEEIGQTEPLPWPLQRFAAEDIYRAATERGEAAFLPLLAGQCLRGLEDGQAASEIVSRDRRAGCGRARGAGGSPVASRLG